MQYIILVSEITSAWQCALEYNSITVINGAHKDITNLKHTIITVGFVKKVDIPKIIQLPVADPGFDLRLTLTVITGTEGGGGESLQNLLIDMYIQNVIKMFASGASDKTPAIYNSVLIILQLENHKNHAYFISTII